ncbi:MAG TPA: CocE/NonD family hydrolase [Caulobacteraceae bacterium]
MENLLRALSVWLLLFAIFPVSQARALTPQPISGSWIGGLDDSGKRTLSVSLEPAPEGVRLNLWQKTGDPYSTVLTANTIVDGRIELRSADGARLVANPEADGAVRGEVSLPVNNIGGKVLLVRRGDGRDAAARYERIWRDGFLGPESYAALAGEAARRRDTGSALLWLQRGRGAKRPLNDALLFSGAELDDARRDPRFAALTHDPVAAHPELSQQTYRVRIDRGVRVPMRDGARLVADIYRPDVAGRFPVVLIRTPYNRGPDIPPGGVDHLAPRGYVVIIQSVRGRDGSEGAFEPWLNERRDGYDSVDWASRQEWSDGNVGMMGLSYLGQAQWQAAVEAHPALKAIIPEVSGTDSFLDTPYDHGILRLSLLQWARGMIPAQQGQVLPPLDDKVLTRLPLSSLDRSYVGQTMPVWQRLLDLDTAEKWDSSNFLADLRKVHIPVLGISGWWDAEANSTIRNYRAMRDLGRENQWLIFGPWEHVWNESTKLKDLDYGPSAVIDFKSLTVRWFDQWLKHKAVNMNDVPKAQIFITGSNQWRTFTDWPAPEARPLDFYLSYGGEGCAATGGKLLRRVSARCGQTGSYVYDPASVTPEGNGLIPETTTALHIDPKAGDMLIYESEPFESATTLAAPGALDLWFSTSAHDADFFVLVFDRDPSGVARALSGPGKMRMSYRGGWSKPRPLTPNKIYNTEFELRPFAHRFERGHRLGIVIRSEWFPSFVRNLNTGEPIKDAVRMETGRETIFGDPRRPSRLRLWVLDEDREPGAG